MNFVIFLAGTTSAAYNPNTHSRTSSVAALLAQYFVYCRVRSGFHACLLHFPPISAHANVLAPSSRGLNEGEGGRKEEADTASGVQRTVTASKSSDMHEWQAGHDPAVEDDEDDSDYCCYHDQHIEPGKPVSCREHASEGMVCLGPR